MGKVCYKSFCYSPASTDMEEEANRFILSHRIVSQKQTLTQIDGEPKTLILLEYAQGSYSDKGGSGSYQKKDEKEEDIVLTAEEFKIFTELKVCRRRLTLAEGVPSYMGGSNIDLRKIVKAHCVSFDDFHKIKGFGESRVCKYGEQYLEILRAGFSPEESTFADGEHVEETTSDEEVVQTVAEETEEKEPF